MALILLATIVDGMDSSIVNVVLPAISEDLGMSVSSSALVSVAYLVPIAGLCLAFSKLAERVNVRRMFLAGTTVFLIASVGCAASPSEEFLVVMRFVQGIGATFMVASTPIMVVRLLDEDHRGRGMGCIAAGSGISVIIGPTVGGILGDLFSWHAVFLINIPICALIVLATLVILPRTDGEPGRRFPDVPSVALMFAGMGLVMIGLYGFTESILPDVVTAIVCVIGGALVLGSFIVSGRSRDPLVHMELLRSRRFSIVTLVFLLSTMAGAGVMYVLPFYMQSVQGLTAAETGMILAGASIITVIATVPTGRWCDSRGCRTPASISLVLRMVFAAMLGYIDPSLGMAYLAVTLAVLGISFGISGTSQSTRMVEESPEEYAGEAGSMAMTVNYVGYALGLALFAIVFSLFGTGTVDVSSMDVSDCLDGFHGSCWFSLLLSAVALVGSLAVGRVRGAEGK